MSIVKQFFKEITGSSVKRMFGWYISTADNPILRKYEELPKSVEYIDLKDILNESLIFPTFNNGLKDIEEYLFGMFGDVDYE